MVPLEFTLQRVLSFRSHEDTLKRELQRLAADGWCTAQLPKNNQLATGREVAMKACVSFTMAGLFFIIPGVVLAEDSEQARTISVSGTAVMKAAPDRVVWRIDLSDFDKDMRAAKQSNDAKVQAVLALRDDLDIGEQELETGHLSISREYERGKYGERNAFKHYAVRRSVTIRQTDLKRFDEYLDKLVASSEMEVNFNFESSKMHEIRAETRLKALAVAKEKAAAMAEVVGAELGRIKTIREHAADRSFSSPMSNAAFTHSPPPVDVASDRFVPGAISMQVSVYATFELK